MHIAEDIAQKDHAILRFYIPPEARWENISRQTKNIGKYLTSAVHSIAKENPKLQVIFCNKGGRVIISRPLTLLSRLTHSEQKV